jgi:hypothetical protein
MAAVEASASGALFASGSQGLGAFVPAQRRKRAAPAAAEEAADSDDEYVPGLDGDSDEQEVGLEEEVARRVTACVTRSGRVRRPALIVDA